MVGRQFGCVEKVDITLTGVSVAAIDVNLLVAYIEIIAGADITEHLGFTNDLVAHHLRWIGAHAADKVLVLWILQGQRTIQVKVVCHEQRAIELSALDDGLAKEWHGLVIAARDRVKRRERGVERI